MSFGTLQLHNTKVVVDASDFQYYLYNLHKDPRIYGGEYLNFVSYLRKYLNILKLCKIKPYFIFGSDCQQLGNQLYSEFSNTYSTKSDSNNDNPSLHLVFLDLEFTDIAKEMNMICIKSSYPSIISCISLATMLDCPLLATASEYFLTDLYSGTNHNSCFIPLDFLSLDALKFDNKIWSKCVPANGNILKTNPDECYFLVAHQFFPNMSCLKTICCAYRPLVGLLLGSNTTPNIQLPIGVNEALDCEPGYSRYIQRWLSLLFWFKQFTHASMEPIKKILATYAKRDQGRLCKVITECLSSYFPNRSIGSFLNQCIKNKFSNGIQFLHFICNVQDVVTDVEAQNWQDRLNYLLVNRKTMVLGGIDFVTHWPCELLQTYCKNSLAPYILTPVYSKNGVVFLLSPEDLNVELSAYYPSLFIRLAHYRLIIGLETKLHQKHKFNNPILEHVRNRDRIVTYHIDIDDPLVLNPDSDCADNIISQLLELPITQCSLEPRWFNTIVLSLVLWYRSELQIMDLVKIEMLSVILAIVAIAIANSLNVKQSYEGLDLHYETLIEMMKSHLTKSDSEIKLNLIHQYISIQLTHNYFRSLVSLVNCLLDQKSSTLEFTSVHLTFPSGQLVYWLSMELESEIPENRFHLTLRYWLPRLLRIKTKDMLVVKQLKMLSSSFELVMSKLFEFSESYTHVPFVSYTKSITEYSPSNPSNLDSRVSPQSVSMACANETYSNICPLFSDHSDNYTTVLPNLDKKYKIAKDDFNGESARVDQKLKKKSKNYKSKPIQRSTSYAAHLKERLQLD